jgi:hypothetical protein
MPTANRTDIQMNVAMPAYLSEDCTVEALKLADAVEARPGPPFGAVKAPIGQPPPESQHLLRLVSRPVLVLAASVNSG